MTVAELINLARTQTQEAYDDSTWIGYVNLALDDLTPVAKILWVKAGVPVVWSGSNGTVTIVADADLANGYEFLSVWHEGSSGARQLRRLPTFDDVSEGWKLTSTQILLQNVSGVQASDTIRVEYYRKLAHVGSASDDIETVSGLPSEYHNLVLLYCIAKARQREEELDTKTDAYNEYLLGKQLMALERIWMMEPQHRKEIRQSRLYALLGGRTRGR